MHVCEWSCEYRCLNSSLCKCMCACVCVSEIVSGSFVCWAASVRLKDAHHREWHGQQHKRQSVTPALCLIASHCFGRWVHKRRPTYCKYSRQPPVCYLLLAPETTCTTCSLFIYCQLMQIHQSKHLRLVLMLTYSRSLYFSWNSGIIVG